MAVSSHDAFAAAIAKSKRAPPVVVIFGEEAHFRDAALSSFVAAARAPIVLTLHGPEGPRDPAPLDLPRFLDEARTASLFGARKVVVLRRADLFLKTHAAEVANGLGRLPPGTAVALVLDGGGKPPKAILDAFAGVECKRPYDTPPPWARPGGAPGPAPAVAFVLSRARDARKAMARPAAERLVAAVGSSRARLASEVEKLSLHAGDRPEITADDVEALCERARTETAYPFADAVAAGDAAQALRLLAAILERGLALGSPGSESVVVDAIGIGAILVATLHSRFREIATAAELARGGLSAEAAAEAAGAKPFARARVAADARRHARTDFARAFEDLVRADRGLKGGDDSPGFVLERLVLALAGGPAAVRREAT